MNLLTLIFILVVYEKNARFVDMFLMGKELDWFDIFVIGIVLLLIKYTIEKIFVIEIDSVYASILFFAIVATWNTTLRNKQNKK